MRAALWFLAGWIYGDWRAGRIHWRSRGPTRQFQ